MLFYHFRYQGCYNRFYLMMIIMITKIIIVIMLVKVLTNKSLKAVIQLVSHFEIRITCFISAENKLNM